MGYKKNGLSASFILALSSFLAVPLVFAQQSQQFFSQNVFESINQLGAAFDISALGSQGLAFLARFMFVFGLFLIVKGVHKKAFKKDKVGFGWGCLYFVGAILIELALELNFKMTPLVIVGYTIYGFMAVLMIGSFMWRKDHDTSNPLVNWGFNLLFFILSIPFMMGMKPLDAVSPVQLLPFGLGGVATIVWMIFGLKLFFVDLPAIFTHHTATSIEGHKDAFLGTGFGKGIQEAIENHSQKKQRESEVGPAIKSEKKAIEDDNKIIALLEKVKLKISVLIDNAVSGKIAFESERSKEIPSMLGAINSIKVNKVKQGADHENFEVAMANLKRKIEVFHAGYGGPGGVFEKGLFKDVILQKMPNTFLAAYVCSDAYKAMTLNTSAHGPDADFVKIVDKLNVTNGMTVFTALDAKRAQIKQRLDALQQSISRLTPDISVKTSVIAEIDQLIAIFKEGIKLTETEAKELIEVEKLIEEYDKKEEKHEQEIIKKIEAASVAEFKQFVFGSYTPTKKTLLLAATDTQIADLYDAFFEYDAITKDTLPSFKTFFDKVISGSETVNIDQFLDTVDFLWRNLDSVLKEPAPISAGKPTTILEYIKTMNASSVIEKNVVDRLNSAFNVPALNKISVACDANTFLSHLKSDPMAITPFINLVTVTFPKCLSAVRTRIDAKAYSYTTSSAGTFAAPAGSATGSPIPMPGTPVGTHSP